MVDVKQVAAFALSSALADWGADQPLSLTTIREIRLAHSLLTDGLPSADELRPFLGEGWAIRSRGRTPRTTTNAISEAEYGLAQIRALSVRVGIPERFVSDLLCQPETADEPVTPGSAETVADLIDLMVETSNQQEEDWMALTWWAIIRLANGNQQRIEVLADNQVNARLMIESQYGRGTILSGPHRLDLMRAR